MKSPLQLKNQRQNVSKDGNKSPKGINKYIGHTTKIHSEVTRQDTI